MGEPPALSEWSRMLEQARRELAGQVVPGESFALIDNDRLRIELAQWRAIPVPERDGDWAGRPGDGETAVRELERAARESGTVVIAWPAFWWLDQFAELRRHLRVHYRQTSATDRLLVFRRRRRLAALVRRALRAPLSASGPAPRASEHGEAGDGSLLAPVRASYLARHRPVVQTGPFAGMRVFAEDLPAMLIGCFEREIHPAVEAAIATGPTTLINVGAGSGYYAVGFALRCPGLTAYASEISPRARGRTQELARMNDVEARVVVRGECDHEWLARNTPPGTVLIVDCEGCELELLDPELVPSLRACSLIVELHEFVRAGVTKIILERFGRSHHVQLIDSEPRFPFDFSELDFMKYDHRYLAIQEFRPAQMSWAVLTP